MFPLELFFLIFSRYIYQVIFIPHGYNKERSTFTHITTHSGRDIKMTQNHILPAGTCSLSPSSQSAVLPLVYASQVSVGDCIMTVSGQDKVLTAGLVVGEGVYTIVTNEVYRVSSIFPYPRSLWSCHCLISISSFLFLIRQSHRPLDRNI